MLVRFWGTRGSIASPGPATNRFGGNTSCVEIVTKAGQRFICDCGTGARPLGLHLMQHEPQPMTATILLSHTHWDHIQGFPFFAPVFVPGNRLTVCAPQGASRTLPEVLSGQMEYQYFPVELKQLAASIQFQELTEGIYELNGVHVQTQFLNHPSITLGYRIEADGVSVVYLCDHEPYWETLWRSDAKPGKMASILHGGDLRHAAFMEKADVVIHDSQYTSEEYQSKRNWGHSTYSFAVQIAAAAKVKRLFLTHHDPTHSDDFLSDVEAQARAIAQSLHSPIVVSCAAEGYEETFEKEAAPSMSTSEIPVANYRRQLRVLVVDDDEDLRLLARRALVQGGHEVQEASGGAEALKLIASDPPDLLLLDLLMPPPNGLEVLRTLRMQQSTRLLPVVVLTAKGDEETMAASFELGATDFLNKPFTPPQLDARIRSCFARAAAQK